MKELEAKQDSQLDPTTIPEQEICAEVLVEKYAKADAWTKLKDDDLGELAQKVAGLPSEVVDEDEDAKRFDLLMLRLQLTLLRSEPGFERLREQVKAIAGVLEEKSAIPMVRDQIGPHPGDPDRRVLAGHHRAAPRSRPQAPARAREADRKVRTQDRVHGLRR